METASRLLWGCSCITAGMQLPKYVLHSLPCGMQLLKSIPSTWKLHPLYSGDADVLQQIYSCQTTSPMASLPWGMQSLKSIPSTWKLYPLYSGDAVVKVHPIYMESACPLLWGCIYVTAGMQLPNYIPQDIPAMWFAVVKVQPIYTESTSLLFSGCSC